jgi:serine/threonine protein kinase
MELCDMNLNDYIQSTTAADPSKSLPRFIKGGGANSLLQIWTVMSQIASGVEYIHREHQIHRDIKPGNSGPKRSVANLLVLYSSKSSVWKLADFGLSTEGSSHNLSTKYSNGTPGYRAPELMDSDGDPARVYNYKVDIWAMGCILYELATGIRPFKSDWEVLNHRFSRKNINVVLDDSFDTKSVETITKYTVDMLQIDPAVRPSASFLFNEFNRQLQLAQHSVLLRAKVCYSNLFR